MADKLKDDRGVMITNKKKCKTCIFNQGQKIITPQRLAEIQAYLIQGTNHQCHHTPYLCRGGREWQAEMFYRLERIDKPTVECLEQAIIDSMK